MTEKRRKKTTKPKEEKKWVKITVRSDEKESDKEEMDGLGVTFEQAMKVLSRQEKEN